MTEEQKISYAIGHNIGQQFAGVLSLDPAMVVNGIQSVTAGTSLFSEEEMQQIFMLVQKKFQEHQQKAAGVEKERGIAFLAENRKKEGVKETSSGLQYKVVKMGTGNKPVATDRVKVHYHGTTIDGDVFDSSVERGEPITFGLNQVIAGWTEGVQLMPVGSKFIFYIPSDLAYGDRAMGDKIKAGSTLIFEVELFEINPK
ncbi:MAG: FKBP-type peptidyl-prolyl cis-trans isomerase [Bacteroidales bacterium]|nr:FKBP-type peptidyl-prolyl cis-trans isomerase [Bacteroidales bacterium]